MENGTLWRKPESCRVSFVDGENRVDFGSWLTLFRSEIARYNRWEINRAWLDKEPADYLNADKGHWVDESLDQRHLF